MAYESLKQEIRQYIKTNGEQEITGQILQNVLIEMVNQYPSTDGYATQSWVTTQLAGYATTSQLAGYLPLTGGTLTGTLTVNSNIVGYNIQSDGVITAGGDVTATGFIKRGGQANQFLKADGSVDSNSYALASSLNNYLPLSGGTLTGNLDLGGNTLEMAIGDYSSSLNGSSLTFAHTEGQASIRLSTVDKFLSLTGTKILLNGVDSSTYITESALSGYATQSWVTTQLGDYLPLIGGYIQGNLHIGQKLSISAYGGSPEDPESYDFYLENGVINIDSRTVIERFSIKADSIIKNEGTADQVLCADGSVKTLSELKAALDAL